jgi:hypothetical protein
MTMFFAASFTRDLVSDLRDVLVGEAAAEVLLQGGLQPATGDERVFRIGVADDAPNFLLDRWQNAHERILTY